MKKIICLVIALLMVFSCAIYVSAKAEFVIKASLDRGPNEPDPVAFLKDCNLGPLKYVYLPMQL